MQIAIIQFPGSNCERETMLAVKRAGMEPVEFLWNESKEKLRTFQGFIIVGGFSYEDRLRAGIIAALDPLMQVLKEQNELGKPILGICNGAQILVEAGLVPGIEKNKVGMVLTDNKRIQQGKILGTGFYNAWVYMRLSDHYQRNAFTRRLMPTTILHVPVAHGEGRFMIPPALLSEMQSQGQTLFQYCDATGLIQDEFPINPNGSIDNLAAVSNKAGNVMAMMPHPERTPNGDAIFQSMREYIQSGYVQKVAPLHYYPRELPLTPYRALHHELVIELLITDNHAMSLEKALADRGILAKIKRQVHWEIDASEEIIEKIKKTGVLYNTRKEKIISLKTSATKSFLVRAKDDMLGLQKKQMLADHFSLNDIHSLKHGIVWHIETDVTHIDSIINSHILFNSYAHDCYDY